jgi:hypothetical protein
MRGQQQNGQRDEQFRVCPREREREGMALPSRHVPSVADTAHGPPAIIRAALRPGPPSCVVQNGEGEGGGGAPRSCAGMAGAAVRSAERNCKCNGKRCWLRAASASASDETSEVRKPAAGEARAPNRDMAVSLASARHPVLTPGAPFTRSFLAACSWNATLLFLGGEEKKSRQEMSVLLKLPPHMASPSLNVQWSTPSTCSTHDDAAGLDSTQ